MHRHPKCLGVRTSRTTKAVVSAVLSLAIAGCAGSGAWFTNQRQQVLEADGARVQASIDQDWETLAKLLAREFVYHQPNGKMADKKTYLESQKSGALRILSNAPQESSVRVYQRTAVSRGLSQIDFELDGEKQSRPVRYLNVWIFRDGRWQLAARQSAFAPGSSD